MLYKDYLTDATLNFIVTGCTSVGVCVFRNRRRILIVEQKKIKRRLHRRVDYLHLLFFSRASYILKILISITSICIVCVIHLFFDFLNFQSIVCLY